MGATSPLILLVLVAAAVLVVAVIAWIEYAAGSCPSPGCGQSCAGVVPRRGHLRHETPRG